MTKLAVVVGASRGVGLGLAKRLAKEEYRVIGTCRSVPEELQGDAAPFQVVEGIDVAEDACVDKLREALAKESRIDLLVFNAGVNTDIGNDIDSVDKLSLDGALKQMNTNCLGAARTMKALGEKLGEGSKVILVSSRYGSIEDNGSVGGDHGYRMSKTALNMLGKCLSLEYAPKGIVLALLHPGLVSTEMTSFHKDGISVEESVEGFMQRISTLSKEQHGHFLHAVSGEELPW
ncbi:Dehydrogenase/reductase SDR family member 4 [Hondaea fermentalgiana]|uniref:Dehydrogenase/reductase SDR family member 4 n=1 Tax=Hondaea fermentalgiana TaxID=2315210 RepID=A0A2R5GFF1_9STRA|nr:Dehydrogenase/reductase SDR family member 4 [Hondaea fermentalgiana]|eukprot:GBG29646.1 Dehydrogenase/reductase SDR family member 4 [Hondaea fermentalgiana]